jgi:glycosyltransferase involved in cell wall biosynthesis
MRVLFIAPRFLPEIGGVEKHVSYVANKLAEQQIEISILSATGRKDLRPIDQLGKIKVFRFFYPFLTSSKVISVLNLIKTWVFFLKNFRLLIDTEIIHLHDAQTFTWIVPFIYFLRKPIFITFHGFDKYPIPNSARIIRKIAEKKTNGNICVGKFLVKWYATTPDYITIGGVEPSRDLPKKQPEQSALFVGRLAEDTDILQFVEALLVLKQTFGINLPLHICGDGPLRDLIIEKAIKNNLEITMHGFVEEPYNYLFKYRYAFVTGFLSILEAMINNRLVFTIYNNPLKKDYIYSIPNAEDLMIIAGSPKELAEKIYVVINEPTKILRYTKPAFAFASNQTWGEVANTYTKLYKKVLD